ncbi:hypothetical protein IFM89_037235 [Coptis chinensis]|uniref:Uncharacterized protein n=1 Tax=Coptis chinensis TaxID=261450 RepID=A0A835LHN4_9MAGN|nr:hypothetical protein IFM89_037235 [Coptis chinensis]
MHQRLYADGHLLALRGLRPLTVDCCAAKLFAKHMKVEDQVSMLKSRVNIASGTPSRCSGSNSEGGNLYLAYVAEGLGKSQNWKDMETSEEEWVTVYSPSTTVAALAKLQDINCLNYLR